jgi:ribosomal protein S1
VTETEPHRDEALRSFLGGLRVGQLVTGTVAEVRDFGVFVNLDGEPAGHRTGFIRVPDLSWSAINQVSDFVEVGQRVTAAVVNVDPDRPQVAVSLKAVPADGGSR